MKRPGRQGKKDGDGTTMRNPNRPVIREASRVGHYALMTSVFIPAKATAPAGSWWLGKSREELQTAAGQEQHRMQFNKFGRMVIEEGS